MQIAFIGAGYVADFYASTLRNHPELTLRGIFDRDSARMTVFADNYHIRAYTSLAQLLADPEIKLVVNLTNPRNHYLVSNACLEAGKHVYSEKPLGMTLAEARSLETTAQVRGLRLGGAPCNMLSDAFLEMQRLIRSGCIGKVKLAYAEMDDGMVHRLRYRHWRNSLGTPWPAADEFEIGCTFEHAGYQLALLASLFGPAERLTSTASCQVPLKAPDLQSGPSGPDLSIGVIEYREGVVARLTCSVLAPEDRSLTIVGEDGWIVLPEVWDYHATLRHGRWKQGVIKRGLSRFLGMPHEKRIPVPAPRRRHWSKGHRMDFARGIAEFADAIRSNRRSAVDADLAVHIVELTDMLQQGTMTSRQPLVSSFAWAPEAAQ